MNLPRFGVKNPVPINLLMAGFIISGIIASFTLRKQFFPDMNFDSLSISMAFPGASPEDIEETIAIRIENALFAIDDIDKINTSCSEGSANLFVSFNEGTQNIDDAIDRVKRTVDSIRDLPEEVERPVIRRIEPSMPVIMVEMYGDSDQSVMKKIIRDMQDDLRAFPEMGAISIGGDLNDELTVTVHQDKLIEFGISITEVSSSIREWMSDIPGGTLRSDGGDIVIRTQTPEEASVEIGDIVIRASKEGESLLVKDVADVNASLVDVPIATRFNSKPSMHMYITKSGDQDIVKIAQIVRAYVDGRNRLAFHPTWMDYLQGGQSIRKRAWDMGSNAPDLPSELSLSSTTDLARFVEGRLNLLTENALYGGVLVFLLLFLALSWRVALWVGIGLITALCGTLVIMSIFGITLNMLTMFGLIVVLGLLVDDAIVVAENIKAQHEKGESAMEAAVTGTSQVLWPVVATVLTSIVAFLPLTFVKGNVGDMLGALPMIVACALAMSLFEALLILPGHLGHTLKKSEQVATNALSRMMKSYENTRNRFIYEKAIPFYTRILSYAIRFRYISLSVSLSTLIFSFGLIAGGRVGYEFMTVPDAETVLVNVRMPEGTPFEQTEQFLSKVEHAASVQYEVNHISAVVGAQMDVESGGDSSSSHLAQLFVELLPSEDRDINANAVIDNIRSELGDFVHYADNVSFDLMSGAPGGADITIQIKGKDITQLQAASEMIRNDLYSFMAINDIADDASAGQRELLIEVRDGATSIGLNQSNVATQVRGAVYGLDAHVFAQSGEEVDVRVKMGDRLQRSLGALEHMWVISPTGLSIPLVEVASITEQRGFSTISRYNRERTLVITADCEEHVSPEAVYAQFPFQKWKEAFPEVDFASGGRQEQQMQAFESLPLGFAAACLMIYVILAWLFGSYAQPLIVMLGIPFALIGVIWGHYVAGINISFLSLIGFVALSGVVVNDSLILVEFYNSRRGDGMATYEALLEAGAARLRPIFLTTVTTVLGLTPLMLEQSMQAKFLIPMAIAISFGLMSATVLILLLLPALLMIGVDIKRFSTFLWTGRNVPSV